jgi:hypothetical protein
VPGASSSLDLAMPHSWSGGVWTGKQVRQGGEVISRERREVEGQADVCYTSASGGREVAGVFWAIRKMRMCTLSDSGPRHMDDVENAKDHVDE